MITEGPEDIGPEEIINDFTKELVKAASNAKARGDNTSYSFLKMYADNFEQMSSANIDMAQNYIYALKTNRTNDVMIPKSLEQAMQTLDAQAKALLQAQQSPTLDQNAGVKAEQDANAKAEQAAKAKAERDAKAKAAQEANDKVSQVNKAKNDQVFKNQPNPSQPTQVQAVSMAEETKDLPRHRIQKKTLKGALHKINKEITKKAPTKRDIKRVFNKMAQKIGTAKSKNAAKLEGAKESLIKNLKELVPQQLEKTDIAFAINKIITEAINPNNDVKSEAFRSIVNNALSSVESDPVLKKQLKTVIDKFNQKVGISPIAPSVEVPSPSTSLHSLTSPARTLSLSQGHKISKDMPQEAKVICQKLKELKATSPGDVGKIDATIKQIEGIDRKSNKEAYNGKLTQIINESGLKEKLNTEPQKRNSQRL